MYSFPIRTGEHDVQLDQSISRSDPHHHSSSHHQEPLLSAVELHVTRPNASSASAGAMQLMTFNSLLMFDIVFVFFLFLVGVTCLVYYLPPTSTRSSSATSASAAAKPCRHHHLNGGHYSALHHHCAGAQRMSTHREHGFAAAAVLSSVECDTDVADVATTGDRRGAASGSRGGSGSATIEFFTATAATAAKFADEGLLIERPSGVGAGRSQLATEATATVATTSSWGGGTRTVPQCCYVKEKWQKGATRKCQAPVHEV